MKHEKNVSRTEFERLKVRMTIMAGYNKKILGFGLKQKQLLIANRLMQNEITTLHKRIDKLKQQFRNNRIG